MIPNIIHFVFGMAEDFGGKPFSLSHYLAVKSAAVVNRPQQIYFHYQFEPSGKWWEKAKPLLTLNKVIAPDIFMGCRLYHTAHKADVVRLQMLQQFGGVYLDMDTICVQSFQPFYNNDCVIGQEENPEKSAKNIIKKITYTIKSFFTRSKKPTIIGLCNAVILAEKNSVFISRWLNSYHSFRSKGRDKYWNEHSVIVPEKLALKNPGSITILGPHAFHYPLYNKQGLQEMHRQVKCFPEAYVHHLWESFSWNDYLSKLTPENIFEQETTYSLLARKYLSTEQLINN